MSGIDQLRQRSLFGLVNYEFGRTAEEQGPCPYRNTCSLYKPQKGVSALTEDAKRFMCDHGGVDSDCAPKVGWIHDTGEGTVCEAYIGKRIMEAVRILAEKALTATGKDKYDLGGL
ncbi:Uncharacterised protein [uncultured archaeon]|nr:Uncharacterised protein [uncultured archaeon]